MKLSDITVPVLTVEGYPQLRMIEPEIDELAQIAERFKGFNPNEDREHAGETLIWLFANFVRDAEGEPLEGVDTVDEALKVRPTMIHALTMALNVTGADLNSPLAERGI